MPNYSFQSLGMHRKQKFRDSFFSEKVSLLFCLLPFAFSPPRFFYFSFSPFFSFVGHVLGYLLVGKDFAKRSRIVNFFLKEVPVGSGTRFSSEFSAQGY